MGEPKLDWLECFSNGKAVCPYCGYEDPDSWEFDKVGFTDTECPRCGEPYTVDAVVDIRYTTAPMGGWHDGN